MTESMQNELRFRLESRRDEITRNVHVLLAQLAIDPSGDSMDRVRGVDERNNAVQAVVRMSKDLHDVKAALKRIEEGTFGTCSVCGGPLSHKRLQVLPWAPCCIVCQERQEFHSDDAEAA